MNTAPAIHHQDDEVTVYHGDCLDVLRALPDASVDSVVTDPPYGLEFMGKDWDAPWKASSVGRGARVATERAGELTERGTGHATSAGPYLASGIDSVRVAGRPFQEWCEAWARECLRVLKPGGHMLAFGGTRTWHRLACAVEDAGFEIRDNIAWMYGSGFPKSLDVSKAIDKAAGAEREVIGFDATKARPNKENFAKRTDRQPTAAAAEGWKDNGATITAPATPEAEEWEGWGTALKPAFEPVVVARKPLAGTVVANVLAHGTGALNIDGCRVGDGSESRERNGEASQETRYTDHGGTNFAALPGVRGGSPAGRWPANVVLDESQAAALDEQSGELTSGKMMPTHTTAVREVFGQNAAGGFMTMETYGDTGGASRFFYVAKAPSQERPRVDGVAHPTVKPLALMRWLLRLVTPPGGVALDPFAGSGTTVEACIAEGFRCVAVEKGGEYLPLIDFRIRRRGVIAPDPKPVAEPDPDELSFDYLPGGAA